MRTPAISEEALAVLQGYGWPGNVRQLSNIMERKLILAPVTSRDNITVDQLPPELAAEPGRLRP